MSSRGPLRRVRSGALFAALFAPCSGAQDAADPYVVLVAVDAEDPFDAVGRVLERGRAGELVRFDPADLEPVRLELRRVRPRYVALVMRPEQIEFGFARRFLQLATEIDDDPFVDFAFGYLTGRDAQTAVALAERGIAREPKAEPPRIASVIGGVEESVVASPPQYLRRERLDAVRVCCAGAAAFPADGRDLEFLAAELPKLGGRDAVTFVGHGWPREVVGGPTYRELRGLRLDGAVALNVACFTGVTATFYEDDWGAGVVRRREIPPDESFCLAVLDSGVVGYTAYLCPRPAGPELDTDLAALIADGQSLGDARRRDYDKTVLGFLGYGEARLELAPIVDSAPLERPDDVVREIMLEGATGGVLFGDPACVPFAPRVGQSPVAITVEEADDHLLVRARAAGTAVYLHCADPTAVWGETMAMRVHARLPLGRREVQDVVVDSLKLGRQPLPSRVLWAIEEDRGERFLQLKVNFPRQQVMLGTLTMIARVVTRP